LRIGTDDLLGLISAEETFLRLSELAEKILQMVYKEAWRRLVQRRGKPRNQSGKDASFACFSGGKFGGRELVFGSDLDLFFVYEGEGHSGRTHTTNSVFFIELAQEIIHLLDAGALYEVDARLRPEGGSAPMVISLPAYRRYLKNRASTWERLALTRMRWVAGDPALGQRVQRAAHRFVFRSPVDAALIEEMLHVRRRMEPRQERGRPLQVDLKRGPGGLVDIEFIAQILVLKLGKKRRQLRLTNTRQVLAQTLQMGHLDESQGHFLLDSYDRLREVEKAMRRVSNQASQLLPTGPELASLARSVGQPDPEALSREIQDLVRETRRIFTDLFAQFARGPKRNSTSAAGMNIAL
jgi:glutamate-ammonia-ligase adenylyltransferase